MRDRTGKRIVVPLLAVGLVSALLATAQITAAGAAAHSVVINEIHYNPGPTDASDAEFLEIHNPGTTAIDLTGYTLTGMLLAEQSPGVPGTLTGTLQPGEYAIIAPENFDTAGRWGVEPIARASGGLSGAGELIEILDAGSTIVDSVDYGDGNNPANPGWPNAADGTGKSLELIDPLSDNSLAASWAASIGEPTPAAENSVSINPPGDAITDVAGTPMRPNPGQDVTVTATIPGVGGGAAPDLYYVVGFGSETPLTMADNGVAPDAQANDEIFTATIPGQAAGELVRYRIDSTATATEAPTDGRNYFGVVVLDGGELPTGMPLLEWFIPDVDYDFMFDDKLSENIVFGSVLAIDGVVYDNMEVKIRGGNYARINFLKQGLSFDFAPGVVMFNGDFVPHAIDEFALGAERGWTYGRQLSSWTLSDEMGFAPVPAAHVQVRKNGDFYGVFRFSEKLDGTWRTVNGIQGEFYKVVSPGFGNAATGFEKKQPGDNDLTNITNFVNAINAPSAAAKTDYVWSNLDVANAVNYMALANLIGHFDSATQNFYLHNDTALTGQWSIHPWDLTNTFGVDNGGAACGNGLAAEVNCLNNPLYRAITDVPEFDEMIWRRMRTILDGPMADGVLEGQFAAYYNTISAAERSADAQIWQQTYQTVSSINAHIDDRRNTLLGHADLPASQTATGVVINEIHYSPLNGVEFVEFYNPTSQSIDMSGWQIPGASLSLPGGSVILAGEYLVATKSIPAFRAFYPSVDRTVLVQYSGGFSSNGELVQLIDRSANVIDEVSYLPGTQGWPAAPNGTGVSLELIDPALDNSLPASWGSSTAIEGSPGAPNNPVSGPLCNGLPVTIVWGPGAVATAGDDVILGTSGADTIDGLAGDDTICGLDGNDSIRGGAGRDRIFGDDGRDRIFGGDGNDTIFGGLKRDVIVGNSGRDVINGNGGRDRINGSTGDDKIRGNGGDDQLKGGRGIDYANGGNGSDSCIDFETLTNCEV